MDPSGTVSASAPEISLDFYNLLPVSEASCSEHEQVVITVDWHWHICFLLERYGDLKNSNPTGLYVLTPWGNLQQKEFQYQVQRYIVDMPHQFDAGGVQLQQKGVTL